MVDVLPEEIEHYQVLRELNKLQKSWKFLASKDQQRQRRKLNELSKKIETLKKRAITLKEQINELRTVDYEINEIKASLQVSEDEEV